MAIFRPGSPVITSDPKVLVDAGLRPGTYHFQLVVENQRGRRSQPAIVTVVVQAR